MSQCIILYVFFVLFFTKMRSTESDVNVFILLSLISPTSNYGISNCCSVSPLPSDAFHQIIRDEGIQALWNGTFPSLLLVFNPAIQFMFYEGLKRNILRRQEQVRDESFRSWSLFVQLKCCLICFDFCLTIYLYCYSFLHWMHLSLEQ